MNAQQTRQHLEDEALRLIRGRMSQPTLDEDQDVLRGMVGDLLRAMPFDTLFHIVKAWTEQAERRRSVIKRRSRQPE